MPAPMPHVLVLIVCKTIATPYASSIDQENSAYTGYQPREYAIIDSMMHCRRQVVPVMPMDFVGADPENSIPGDEREPFTLQKCQRAGIVVGTQWDAAHPSSSWRFWRVACPVPVVRTNPDGSEEIIRWELPECGHRDVVRCDSENEI